MATKPFDASKYLSDLNGRDYLEVKWRLLWLRTEHPDAIIETELVKQGAEMALFRARVAIPEAGSATGWGSETAEDFGDYIEKAETKALGRALAALGYGTQFCEDFAFSSERKPGERRGGSRPRRSTNGKEARVVDSPVAEPRGLKVVRESRPQPATSSQVNAIYAIGRADDVDVEKRSRKEYGCPPGELSKRQASELIDRLREGAALAKAAQSS